LAEILINKKPHQIAGSGQEAAIEIEVIEADDLDEQQRPENPEN